MPEEAKLSGYNIYINSGKNICSILVNYKVFYVIFCNTKVTDDQEFTYN